MFFLAYLLTSLGTLLKWGEQYGIGRNKNTCELPATIEKLRHCIGYTHGHKAHKSMHAHRIDISPPLSLRMCSSHISYLLCAWPRLQLAVLS